MKIYLAHSRVYDFTGELYVPLKNSSLSSEHMFIFPHEALAQRSSKNIIGDCDLVLAEVSFPSTGVGIELGWADTMNKPIVAIHINTTQPSPSLAEVTKTFVPYSDVHDMIQKLEKFFAEYQPK